MKSADTQVTMTDGDVIPEFRPQSTSSMLSCGSIFIFGGGDAPAAHVLA
jgi:hypothetical protein